MTQLVNSAPGMRYRKYAHARIDKASATPVIVVEGAPSESEWRNWTAEDLDEAQKSWQTHWDGLCAKDFSRFKAGEAEFARELAAETDHTAKIERRDGVSRLLLDGAPIYLELEN